MERNGEASPGVKYKGVRKRKWGKWVSEIRLPNSRERIWLGSYNKAEKAARAFDVAQFCLRGPTAQLNFPDDPPDVPGWRTFTPAEIQDVAAQYGSDYSRPPPLPANIIAVGQDQQGNNDEEITHVMELDDTSPSSTSEGAIQMGDIDWSFFDALDGTTTCNDFGLFSGDIYVPPQPQPQSPPPPPPPPTTDQDNETHFSHSSFLWNF